MLENIRRALRRNSTATLPQAFAAQAEANLQTKTNGDQARAEMINRFASELTRIGGRFQHCASEQAAVEYIEQLALDRQAKMIVSWDVPVLPGIDLKTRLSEQGIVFEQSAEDRELISKAAEADFGISGVDYALADTGTLVLFASERQPRSVSLLPPVHIAIVRTEQILPGLSELFPLLRGESNGLRNLSSAITFITGPSRTADIELKLVVGVHGPQELHVLLLD